MNVKRGYMVCLAIVFVTFCALFCYKENNTEKIDMVLPLDTQQLNGNWSMGPDILLADSVEEYQKTTLLNKNGQVKIEISGKCSGDGYNGIIQIINLSDGLDFYTREGVLLSKEQHPNSLPFLVYGVPEGKPLIPYEEKSGKFGYINRQGIWFFEPKYMLSSRQNGEFNEDKAIILLDVGVQGVLNNDGTTYVLVRQDGNPSENGFRDNRLAYYKTEYQYNPILNNWAEIRRYTYLTADNKQLFPSFCFEDAKDYNEGIAAVKKDGRWGYIDTEGSTIIDFQYQNASNFENGLACVSFSDDKSALIDQTGTIVSSIFDGYKFCGEYHDGLILVKDKKGYRLIDRYGTIISGKDAFDTIAWKNGAWSFSANEYSYGILARKAQTVIMSNTPIKIYGTVCVVTQNKKAYVYETESGKRVFEAKEIGPFSEGLAPARAGKAYGFINEYGKWVIRPQFSQAYAFSSGLAYVEWDGSRGFIANPLIFKDNWTSNEIKRSQELGLADTSTPLLENLSYQHMQLCITNLFKLQDKLQKERVSAFNNSFSIDEKEIENLFFNEINSYSKQITRKEIAVVFEKLAKYYGNITDFYKCYYNDTSNVENNYLGAVAYTGSLGLFDLEGNCFEPDRIVSVNEFQIALLRFFESMQ